MKILLLTTLGLIVFGMILFAFKKRKYPKSTGGAGYPTPDATKPDDKEKFTE